MTDMRRQDEAPATGPVDAPVDAPTGPVDAPVPPPSSATPPPPPPGPADDQPTYETGGLRLALLIGGVVFVGWRLGWPALVMILGLVVTIFLHELGHYLTAKWSGMKVTEFFIGFGPKIWSFQRGETEYGFKVIPAGAYVRIIGMNNLDETDPADEARTYRQQSFPKRLLVVCAGSLSHLVQAFVIGVVLLGVVGIPGGSITEPRADSWTIDEVVEGQAAEAAGLRVGDEIVAVEGRSPDEFDDLSDALAPYAVGDDVVFTVERDGTERAVTATLVPRPEDQGGEPGTPFLGVRSSFEYTTDPIGVGAAIVQTPGEMWDVTAASVGALGRVFSPTGIGNFAEDVGSARSDRAAEPSGSSSSGGGESSSDGRDPDGLISIVGLVQIGSHDVEHRAAFMLVLFFQANLLLGLFNMLPLPPLDGGHAAVAIYERVRSRAGRRYHADFAKLLPLTYAVVLLLGLVGVTTIYLDLVNPIEL